MRCINDAGLALVKSCEGLRLEAYQDIVGVWTIGYGHTPAEPGDAIDEAQAAALLLEDLARAEDTVDGATRDVATSDDQFSAMVSLAFNIGIGGFRSSSVLRLHRAGDTSAAGAAFLLWDKAHVDGELVTVDGLLRRRRLEEALYHGASRAGA